MGCYLSLPLVFRPTVIDKSWPIESIGLRLRDHTRTLILVFAHGPPLVGHYQG
jgi:hypothetical protein